MISIEQLNQVGITIREHEHDRGVYLGEAAGLQTDLHDPREAAALAMIAMLVRRAQEAADDDRAERCEKDAEQVAEQLQPEPEGGAIYQQRLIRCGKERCRTCQAGGGHGPYWYAIRRDPQTGRVRSTYLGKNDPRERQN